MLSAFAYDLLLIGPYLWVAIQVGSLTILGEVLRGALMITVGRGGSGNLNRVDKWTFRATAA
jgi:hypothetical protein